MPIGDAFEHIGKRKAAPTSVMPLGPDYAALLSVCSLKTWIAPHLLAEVIILYIVMLHSSGCLFMRLTQFSSNMQAVRQLEGLIVKVECETAYKIDPHAQQEIAEMEKEAQLLK